MNNQYSLIGLETTVFSHYYKDVITLAQSDVFDWKSLQTILRKTLQTNDFEIYSTNEDFQHILTHTLKVLYCLMNDQNFKRQTYENQQILLWVGLFHDCAKLAPPKTLAEDGRDPAHPFRSCEKTLYYLQKLKLLNLSNQQVDLWKTIFASAYKEVVDRKTVDSKVEIHNMNVLPKIILFLEKQLKSSFFTTVLKLICMHQCIPCDTYPPVTPINLKEISLYFNKVELQLLEVFWFNDSYSYQYLKENEPFTFGEEIHAKMRCAIQHLHPH